MSQAERLQRHQPVEIKPTQGGAHRDEDGLNKLKRRLANLETEDKENKHVGNSSAKDRETKRLRFLVDPTKQGNNPNRQTDTTNPEDGEPNREVLRELTNTQINNDVTQADLVVPINSDNLNPAGEQSLMLAQQKVTNFVRQMQLQQRLTEAPRTESQLVALQAAEEQIAKAQSAITEQREAQSLSKNLAQKENVTSSNETLQEGAAESSENAEIRALSSITRMQNIEADVKQEVRDRLAEQKKEERPEGIPIQMGTPPTNPTDQPLTKKAASNDSQTKSTKDKNIVDPDEDEFTNALNPGYQYLNSTTLEAARLNDTQLKARL